MHFLLKGVLNLCMGKFVLKTCRRKTSYPNWVFARAIRKVLSEPDEEPDPSKPVQEIIITNRIPEKLPLPPRKKVVKKSTPKQTAAKKSISKKSSKR